jgi:carboxypeptidase C (cathepsin A)
MIPAILDAGVNVLIWTGDADWICSWEANRREADAVVWHGQQEFRDTSLAPYKVGGQERGSFKTIENLSYMRVYEAGHDLAFNRKLLHPLQKDLPKIRGRTCARRL